MSSGTLFDATLGGLTLKQCSQTTFSPNNNISIARGSANLHADAHFVENASPVASFTSRDVAGVLAAVDPSSGLYVTSGTFTLPYRIRAAGGSFASGTSHISLSSANGLIIPTTLSAQNGGPATIGLDVLFESTDGETSPIASNTGVTIGSDASFNAEYRIYTPSINASNVDGVTNFTVNFGINVVHNGDENGFTYPTVYFIEEVNPSIDVTFRDLDAVDALGPLFQAMTAAVFKLRKKAAGGTVVATATGAHITLTFADGIVDMQQLAASETSRGEVTFRLMGESLTVSTTAML